MPSCVLVGGPTNWARYSFRSRCMVCCSSAIKPQIRDGGGVGLAPRLRSFKGETRKPRGLSANIEHDGAHTLLMKTLIAVLSPAQGDKVGKGLLNRLLTFSLRLCLGVLPMRRLVIACPAILSAAAALGAPITCSTRGTPSALLGRLQITIDENGKSLDIAAPDHPQRPRWTIRDGETGTLLTQIEGDRPSCPPAHQSVTITARRVSWSWIDPAGHGRRSWINRSAFTGATCRFHSRAF